MGKSPGKWIKTVLFGKKTSKSSYARGKEKLSNEKEVNVRVRVPEAEKGVNPPEVSSGGLNPVHVVERNMSQEHTEPSLGQKDKETSGSDDQSGDEKQTREVDMLTDAERIAQDNAATTAQAAFRGYLARRAFKALKGIIRLQALIRGHLVRRQAVATLYCIVGIVKLQALARGSRIRSSGAGLEVQKICILKPLDGKTNLSASTMSLSVNTFIRKLLAPSPSGMPLRVQYDGTDPNSVPIWLERWSISCPWKPVSPPKKLTNSKVQRKQVNSQTGDGEAGRPKRSVRKVPSLYDNASAQTSEMEKPRRNAKKVSSHAPETFQENPQHELEKVKRSLRKVHNPVSESSAQTEVIERPSQKEKTSSSIDQEVSAPTEVNPIENIKEETSAIVKEEVTASTENDQEFIQQLVETNQESTQVPVETNQALDCSTEEKTTVESESFESHEKDENTMVSNGELKSAEDSTLTENQKASRRASFPAKQEHVEDGLQNTPKLPSYMQATQSAKAKLRAQGSPRLSQDVADKNIATRRHSLPSSANGKVSSVSPRTPKPIQGSGKSGNKSEKSLLSSRDGSVVTGKSNQTQWRR